MPFSKSSNNPNRCFVSFNGFDTDNTSEIDCNLYKQTEFWEGFFIKELKTEALLDVYLQVSHFLRLEDGREKMRNSPALWNSGN